MMTDQELLERLAISVLPAVTSRTFIENDVLKKPPSEETAREMQERIANATWSIATSVMIKRADAFKKYKDSLENLGDHRTE